MVSPEHFASPEERAERPEKPLRANAPVQKLRVAHQKPTGPAPRLPTREELAALALDVYRLALDAVRAYKDRNGNEKSYPAPDYKAACDSLRVAAHVAGYGAKTEAPSKVERDAAEDELDAEAALQKLRSRIARATEVRE